MYLKATIVLSLNEILHSIYRDPYILIYILFNPFDTCMMLAHFIPMHVLKLDVGTFPSKFIQNVVLCCIVE